MAQFNSCQHPEVSNRAVIYGPLTICSDRDTHSGGDDEEAVGEYEEVELAEEVGEDVLILAVAGNEEIGDTVNETGQQSENVVVRRSEMASLQHKAGEENVNEGNEVRDKDWGKLDEQKTDKGCESMYNIPGSLPVSAEAKNVLDPNKVHQEERRTEIHDLNKAVNGTETDPVAANISDNSSKKVHDECLYKCLRQSGFGTKCSDGETSEDNIQYTDRLQTDLNQVFTAWKENVSKAMTTYVHTLNQSEENQSIIRSQEETKNTNKSNSLDFMSNVFYVGNSEKKQIKDVTVQKNRKNTNAISASDDRHFDLESEVRSEAREETERGTLLAVAFERRSLSESRDEERISGAGVGQTDTVKDEEDERKTYPEDKDKERGLPERQREAQLENLVVDAHLELVEQQVECKFVDGDKASEMKNKGDAPLKERTFTTGGEDRMQMHALQYLRKAEIDQVDKLNPQDTRQLAEDRTETEQENAIEGEVKMGEEPITVLDDYIVETTVTPTRELVTLPSGATVESEEHQELQKEIMEAGREKEEEKKKQYREEEKSGKQVIKDKDGEKEKLNVKEKSDHQILDDRKKDSEINRKDEGLTQAVENGTVGVQPQPLSKEGGGESKLLSTMREDEDWIKGDQQGEGTGEKTKVWSKELRPLRKNTWDNERSQEWTMKEKVLEQTCFQKKEDWIKELKSVIKDESQTPKKDDQVKKKRVVLMEDGHSYIPQQEIVPEEREEVKLIFHRNVESPVHPECRNSRTLQQQDHEISLFVKVMKQINLIGTIQFLCNATRLGSSFITYISTCTTLKTQLNHSRSWSDKSETRKSC